MGSYTYTFGEITSASETTDNPDQTITGFLGDNTYEFYTPPGGDTISQTVITPVPGSPVTLIDSGPQGSGEVVLGTSRTDDGGNFTLSASLPFLGQNNVFIEGVYQSAPGYSSEVTDTLLPAPITATDAVPSVTETVPQQGASAPPPVEPFTAVAITDPNPAQLESATVTVSGPLAGTLQLLPPGNVSGPVTVSKTGPGAVTLAGSSLNNQSASALAAALDAISFTFSPGMGGTDSVSATITDSAGQTTVLSSLASLVLVPPTGEATSTTDTVTLTSAAETSAIASQTISGSVTQTVVSAAGTILASGPVANVPVELTENGAILATAISAADGTFSASVTLPDVGTNSITALPIVPGSIGSTPASVTDTLVAAVSASDAAASVTDDFNIDLPSAPGSGNSLQIAPFQQAVITDPNAGQLESATIAVAGPIPATLSVTSLQNLSAAALATALDAEALTFSGQTSGSDTVTATITDTAGQTTTLTSADSVVFFTSDGGPFTTVPTLALTSAGETGSNDAQTITGTAAQATLNAFGQPVSQAALTGAMVTIFDNGVPIGTAVTGDDGSFSAAVTLLGVGANSITASVASSIGPASSGAPVLDTLLDPPPVTLGFGPDTLALSLSQRAAPAGAQFTISVDGEAVGGVQTTTADTLSGQAQEFDVRGNFPAGSNTVAITYLNASNSLLLLNSASIDGAATSSSLVLSNNGTEAAGFIAPADPNATTLGTGPDTLALFVSERGQPAGAQFTISVNGSQIGGVQTTDADVLAGQVQQFDVLGGFPAGRETVTINYLNASNSLLFLDDATLDGTFVPGSDIVLSNTGSGSFAITGEDPALPTAVATVGSGPDTLTLDTAERAEPAGAQFTVSVDGTQIGGVQTTTADSTAGQFQQLNVLGDFAPGVSHAVSLDYLNASNSLLLAGNATINGATIAGGSAMLSNNGSLGFSFAPPAAPGPITVGAGADTVALSVSEDYFQGNAQFTLSVDGFQLGGVQTANAIHSNSQTQVFDVLDNFSGNHTVSVDFLNAASEGVGSAGLTRNLYVSGATIDGAAIANSALTLTSNGPQTIFFSH